MTRSTGARARQKRREQLLWEELKWAGAMAYLNNLRALARMCGNEAVAKDYVEAFCLAQRAHAETIEESRALL